MTFTRNQPKTAKKLKTDGHTIRSEHRNRADERLRKTTEWRKMSDYLLAREPLCQICGEPAGLRHHIIEPRGDASLFFDENNTASVCIECHNKVHAAYKRGIKWRTLVGD